MNLTKSKQDEAIQNEGEKKTRGKKLTGLVLSTHSLFRLFWYLLICFLVLFVQWLCFRRAGLYYCSNWEFTFWNYPQHLWSLVTSKNRFIFYFHFYFSISFFFSFSFSFLFFFGFSFFDFRFHTVSFPFLFFIFHFYFSISFVFSFSFSFLFFFCILSPSLIYLFIYFLGGCIGKEEEWLPKH